MSTRREFVTRVVRGTGVALGGAAGGSLLAAAGAAAAPGATTATAATGPETPPPSDGALIAGLVGLEQLAVHVYGKAVAAAELTPPARRLAHHVLAHERAHVAALAARLPALGQRVPTAPATDAQAQAALKEHHVQVNFARPRSAKAWLKLLLDVEAMLERNYHLAISELQHATLLELCAQVMASEAQHGVLLHALLHPHDAKLIIPGPFVNGG